MNQYKITFLKSQDKDFKIFSNAIVEAQDIHQAISIFEKNINSFGEIVKISKIGLGF